MSATLWDWWDGLVLGPMRRTRKMQGAKIEVLDHGYVQLVDSMGNDQSLVEAARMSTGKGFLGWGPISVTVPSRLPSGGTTVEQQPGDEKLLSYLWRNAHATPFEFAQMVVEVQAPIFVFREWHRHRTQAFNEASARYAPLPDLNYVPTVERLMLGGGHLTKQAGAAEGAATLTHEEATRWRECIETAYADAQFTYERALKAGVPKELARVVLPVGRYSKMRASASLRNWLGFLKLRMTPQAQWEIRCYAQAVAGIVKMLYPRTWALFEEENGLKVHP